MITLYGISNCDSVRKARRWLDGRGVDYRFHDFRKDGLSAAIIEKWFHYQNEDQLLNRRSRTWRDLHDSEKADLDKTKAMHLMQSQPTLIKRPLLEYAQGLIVGFDEAMYQQAVGR